MNTRRSVIALVSLVLLFAGSATICRAGLIASWSFDNTLADAVGGNNNGTWQGGGVASYSAGIVGTAAVSLDGTHYINTSDVGMSTGNSPSTLAFWGKSAGSGTLEVVHAYGRQDYNGQTRSAQYMWDGGQNKWTLAACSWNGPDANFDAYGTLDNAWHHLVMSYNGTYTTLYVDGQNKLTSTTNQSTRNTTLTGTAYIGRNIPNSGYYVGQLDDMAFWNVGNLGDAKIRSLYTAPQVSGLGDYGAGKMDNLFQVYDGTLTSWTDGSMKWEKVSGLVGHQAGDTWGSGGTYWVQLNGSGGGVATPEPSSWVLLAIAAVSGVAVWRRRASHAKAGAAIATRR
jgi:hypothetical protein